MTQRGEGVDKNIEKITSSANMDEVKLVLNLNKASYINYIILHS
jgi:hypothetical protein